VALISVSQTVGPGPLVGLRVLFVGHQTFLILFKITIAYINFIKFNSIQVLRYKIIQKPTHELVLIWNEGQKETKKPLSCPR